MSLKKSFYNSFFGILSVLVTGVVSLVKISLIVNKLGQEYNGLNNIYVQIFSFLMIGEAGISLATTSMLYGYIEAKSVFEINKILSGSRKILEIILSGIFVLSIIISFGIPYLIKDSNLKNSFIVLTFILFSSRLILIQYFQPLKGFVAANQDEYIIKIFQIFSSLLIGTGEVYILYKKQNYIQMLLFSLVGSIILENLNYLYIKKKYKYISYFFKEKNYGSINHIKELIKINIVSTIAKSIDPLLISKFLGLITTSIYSNYNYIQSFLLTFVGAGLSGFTHYFGKIFSRQDSNKKEKFDNYIVVTNFIGSFFSVMFCIMIEDFICLWINFESRLDWQTTLLISILLYIYISMKPINTLIITNKFFKLASNSSLYEVVINISISLILLNKIGLKGVILGSIISFLTTSFWYFPTSTYKKVFNSSSKDYFFKQLKSFLILIVVYILVLKISKDYFTRNWIDFIIKTLLCSFSSSLIIIYLYYYSFENFKNILSSTIVKIKRKLK